MGQHLVGERGGIASIITRFSLIGTGVFIAKTVALGAVILIIPLRDSPSSLNGAVGKML